MTAEIQNSGAGRSGHTFPQQQMWMEKEKGKIEGAV
jgi:hypothetical protein